MSGYLTKIYAESLSEYGIPYYLSESKGWIIKQKIFNSPNFDALGCYPIFMCDHPENLEDDFRNLNEQIVSLALVTDPFSPLPFENWQKVMPDVCYHYKDHSIIDLQKNYENKISKHHLRNIKKASQDLIIKQTDKPEFLLESWNLLYDILKKRHNITGIAQFSEKGFLKQLLTPGIRATWAEYKNSIVGIVLWYKIRSNVFYHLAGYDELGYQKNASFAIFFYALQKFKEEGIEFVSLGAGAGIQNSSNDGLSRFKKGWTQNIRPVYFCGKIFNKALYSELAADKQSVPFFPAYRAH